VAVLNTTTQFEFVAISAAGTDADTVRDIFLEYGESLGFNTCFGGLDQELATLPGDYAPPRGCLLLAKEGRGWLRRRAAARRNELRNEAPLCEAALPPRRAGTKAG